MATATQETRPMSVTTPLGKDVMLLASFSAQEAVSQLFCYRLGVLIENDAKHPIDVFCVLRSLGRHLQPGVSA